MRLLKRERNGGLTSTNAFSLTKFDPQKIPRYAILSHRWSLDEVAFSDLENGTAETRAGYRKLEFCERQATRDDLLYFWIDTCCIDKTSSAELSEAINSMFKWYKNATKCYVYLPDVSIHNSASGASPEDNWELAFQKSEWFTRGWTIQELLAPTVVEFFSMEGAKLGDKRSLEQHIHRITGISIEALRGKPLSIIDEKERLSWAAKRQTTVEEDAAYCLLGIFDIHMSLIYGEGQQNALARLQRKIQRLTKPSSLIATDAPLIVPFERNPRFTGRESQLAELEGKLFAKDHTSKIAITGLGGVGKTQLVLETLYRTKEKHRDCLIVWIPAITVESLQQGYLAAAQQLEIPGHEDEKADVKKLVQDYLSKDDAGRWLVVFDNADNIDIWTSTTILEHEVKGKAHGPLNRSRCLIDYLPKHKSGCIIFTTRDRKAAVKLAQQNIITVPELSKEAASQLLKTSLINPDLVDNSQDVSALLAALTCLPLAITQAAAYINANSIVLADYLSFLEEKEEETIDILSEEFEDYGRYGNIKNPIATTWLISFEQIRRSDPLAADYLSFIACVNPRDIPQALLLPGSSRKKEIEAIGTLTAYSFVSRRPGSESLDVHRLVHLTTRNWLRKEGLLTQWMEKAIIRLEEVFPVDYHENRATCRLYLPHACDVLASELVREDGEQRLALMRTCGRCLLHDGRWDEAEMMFNDVLAIKKKISGDEHFFDLVSMADLANTYWNQGRWDEAEQLDLQLIEIRETELGLEHLHTLTNMNNLAETYRAQGRLEEAKQLIEKVVATCETKLGSEHPDTFTFTVNLASIYRDLGQLEASEQLLTRTTNYCETKLGVTHSDTLKSMANLASTYRSQGRWEQAEQLDIHVVENCKTKLGAEHPQTLVSMANLAFTYAQQGRWKESEGLEVQVMETRITKQGAEHPSTLDSMNNLAATYRHQGRWEDAQQLLTRAIEAREKKLGVNHPDTLISIANLALVYGDQDRWKEAEELDIRVMEARKIKLGVDHPSTLICMNNLGENYRSQGRLEEAEYLFIQAIEARKVKLGADHPDTLSTMANLALLYWEQERKEEAEQLIIKVIETRKTKLGIDHPFTLTSVANLAEMYWQQGRWEESEELGVFVMETRKTKLGPDHPSTLTSMRDLAFTWKGLGRNMEALELLRDCVRRWNGGVNPAHPLSLSSQETLRDWEAEQSGKSNEVTMTEDAT